MNAQRFGKILCWCGMLIVLACKKQDSELKDYIILEPESEVVVLTDEESLRRSKKNFQKFKNWFKREYNEGLRDVLEVGYNPIEGGATIKLSEIQNQQVGLAINFSFENENPKNIRRDIDKTYGAQGHNEWSKLTTTTQLGIPLGVNLGGYGNFFINASVNTNIYRRYSMTLNTKQPLHTSTPNRPLKSILNNGWQRLVGSIHFLGAIKIPFSTDDFLKQYNPGSEFNTVQFQSVIMALGTGYGLGPLNSGLGYYVSTQGHFERRIKVLTDIDKPVIQFRIKNTNSLARGAYAQSGAQVSFFELRRGPFFADGRGGLNLLSTNLSTTDTNLVDLEYIFDTRFPEAQKAFSQILLGNASLAQQLGRFRYEDGYKGVLIYQQHLSDALFRHAGLALGFDFSGTGLYTNIQGLILRNKKAKAFRLEFGERTSEQKIDHTQTFSEQRHDHVYDYHNYRDYTSFFGMGQNSRRSIRATSQLVEVLAIDPTGNQHTKTKQGKLFFELEVDKNKRGKNGINEFIESASRVIGSAEPMQRQLILVESQENPCDPKKPIRSRIRGTLYHESIETIFNQPEWAVWKALGQLFDIEEPQSLYFAHKRSLITKELDDEELDKQIKKLEKHFIPLWRTGRNAMMLDKLKILRDIFDVYNMDTFAFELLTALARMKEATPINSATGVEGVFVNYSLDGTGCSYSWSIAGESKFRLEDIVRTW